MQASTARTVLRSDPCDQKTGRHGAASLDRLAAQQASSSIAARTRTSRTPPPIRASPRHFLRRSGLVAGGAAALGSLSLAAVRKAEAAAAGMGHADHAKPIEIRKNMCTHCSVGCTVLAEVQNGVWVGQEPAWDSPINRGTHCAKGAAIRETVSGDRRLKYPMKLENGEWKRISWDQAIGEVGDKMLSIRQKSGPDAVWWLGSAKFSNEGAYLYRKMAASGAPTTSTTGPHLPLDHGRRRRQHLGLRRADELLQRHPQRQDHDHHGRQPGGSASGVAAACALRQGDQPRQPDRHRSAHDAHGGAPNEYVRLRPGTDIPVLMGMLWHIFENGWEDKDFIAKRVYGIEQIRAEVKKYDPKTVEDISGVPGEQLKKVAEKFAKEKPATLIWCMGQTQHTVGTANVRASCILLLATGNVGAAGTGANIFRGHTNVQGATDLGLDITSLPLYYGLVEGAWRHWAASGTFSYDYLLSRFVDKKMMEMPGIPSTRWFDAATYDKKDVDQQDNVKAAIVFGHGANTVPRQPDVKKGLEALELLVIADPHPTNFVSLGRPEEQHLPLPDRHADGMLGLAHGLQPLDPVGREGGRADLRVGTDYWVIYKLAQKLGFGQEMFKNIAMTKASSATSRSPNPCCARSTAAAGRPATRASLRSDEGAHAQPAAFRHRHAQGQARRAGWVKGDYYGLPWPCWGTPEFRHPGTAILYNTNLR